jgi:hypothetical protein
MKYMTLIESLDRRLGAMLGNVEIPDNCIGKWTIKESKNYEVDESTIYAKPEELSRIEDITISLIEIYVNKNGGADFFAIKVNDGVYDARTRPGLTNTTLYANYDIHRETYTGGTGKYTNKTGLLVKLEKVDVHDQNNASFYVTWSFTQDMQQDSQTISYNAHIYKYLKLEAEKKD